MTVAQGDRQLSARTIASTTLTHNGDMLAMFGVEATIPAGTTYNAAFILWLQERLGSSSTSLPGLMAAFAAAQSAANWSSVGEFDPSDPLLAAEAVIAAFSPVAWYKCNTGSGTSLVDSSGNAKHGVFGTTTTEPAWVAGPAISFDGGDLITIASLAAVRGFDVVFNSDVTINAVASGKTLLGNINDSGVHVGDVTGSVTNEIITFKQETSAGYSAAHRRAWVHASNAIAAGGWHLLQCDFPSSVWNIVLDGTDRATTTVNTPQEFLTGNWSVARDVHAAARFWAGDIAYLVFYGTARSLAQQAECRTAIAALMAARSITLP